MKLEIESWNWILKLKLEFETWNLNLNLKIEIDTWNWYLKLNLEIKTWNWNFNWNLKLKLKIETWNWNLKLKLEIETWILRAYSFRLPTLVLEGMPYLSLFESAQFGAPFYLFLGLLGKLWDWDHDWKLFLGLVI